jgi:hypothetical protein
MNFASIRFYEYYMVQPIYPDMRMEELFAIETLQTVMIRDASPTIRAMTTHVETPSQVRSIFDSIAYSKCEKANPIVIKS